MAPIPWMLHELAEHLRCPWVRFIISHNAGYGRFMAVCSSNFELAHSRRKKNYDIKNFTWSEHLLASACLCSGSLWTRSSSPARPSPTSFAHNEEGPVLLQGSMSERGTWPLVMWENDPDEASRPWCVKTLRASLVAQWYRICLPMHGFNPWSRKIPHASE